MNTNLILAIGMIAILFGLATLIFMILFRFKHYEPKDLEDIELENAYINSLKVKDAQIVKAKATETHNAFGKIEDTEQI